MSRALALLLALAGCTAELDSRERRVIDALAEDNYMWARRDPALVAMKLRKMQRGPYEWLRGTAPLYWRDLTEPGTDRLVTDFGSPQATRVLLVGDPHVENVGTFRASDGTMFLDWNDFDGTGYGPFTGDVRRLSAAFTIVCGLVDGPPDSTLSRDVVRALATEYVRVIAELAAGKRIGTIGYGVDKLFDKELTKALTRGDARVALDEVAPVQDGVRTLQIGDIETVADDGVIEDRVVAVSPDEAALLDRAIAAWRPNERVVLRMRRIGSGVASYAALRYNVVLASDHIVELKEMRDGLIIPSVPRYGAAEWASPAVRAVNTQIRLQARPDADPLLGLADVGVSFKIRDIEAYQRGINASDLVEVATKDIGRITTIAATYGGLLARAHGSALTADGVPGYTVIAPLLVGREDTFVDEIVAAALADADTITTDLARMQNRNLARWVIP